MIAWDGIRGFIFIYSWLVKVSQKWLQMSTPLLVSWPSFRMNIYGTALSKRSESPGIWDLLQFLSLLSFSALLLLLHPSQDLVALQGNRQASDFVSNLRRTTSGQKEILAAKAAFYICRLQSGWKQKWKS